MVQRHTYSPSVYSSVLPLVSPFFVSAHISSATFLLQDTSRLLISMVHLRPSWSPYAQSRLDSRHHGSLQLRYDNGCRQVDRTIQHTLLETAKVSRGRKVVGPMEVRGHCHRRYHIPILLVLTALLGPLRELSYQGSYLRSGVQTHVTYYPQ